MIATVVELWHSDILEEDMAQQVLPRWPMWAKVGDLMCVCMLYENAPVTLVTPEPSGLVV